MHSQTAHRSSLATKIRGRADFLMDPSVSFLWNVIRDYFVLVGAPMQDTTNCTRAALARIPLSCTHDKKIDTYSCLLMDNQACKSNSECSGGACFKGKCYSK